MSMTLKKLIGSEQERFDDYFSDAYVGGTDKKEMLLFLAQSMTRVAEACGELVPEKYTFKLEEYLPLVKAWNGTNFDVPFDHGYKQAKKDSLTAHKQFLGKDETV